MTDERTLRRRRLVVGAGSLTVTAVLAVALGDPGAHMAQNLLIPGVGLLEVSTGLAVAVFALAIASVVVWVTFGIDWMPLAVVIGSTAAAGLLTGDHAAPVDASGRLEAIGAAHEFPLVVLVVGAIVWLRTALGRAPGAERRAERRAARRGAALGLAGIGDLPPVDRSRAAAIAALAVHTARSRAVPHAPTDAPADAPAGATGGASPDDSIAPLAAAAASEAIVRRSRRIGLLARGRRGDPFAVDHAVARAALALTGQLDGRAFERFVRDAATAAAGVPASEPTWVRPLDATLAAAALDALAGPPAATSATHAVAPPSRSCAASGEAGRRWSAMLAGPLALRRGHRPGTWWTPLGLRLGSAPVWEHAAMSGIARAHGWCGDDDWSVLRPRLLGAAARGTASAVDERAIAAARVWLAQIHDEQAARIVARPTVHRDPLAVALDRYATALAVPAATPQLHPDRLRAERGDLVP